MVFQPGWPLRWPSISSTAGVLASATWSARGADAQPPGHLVRRLVEAGERLAGVGRLELGEQVVGTGLLDLVDAVAVVPAGLAPVVDGQPGRAGAHRPTGSGPAGSPCPRATPRRAAARAPPPATPRPRRSRWAFSHRWSAGRWNSRAMAIRPLKSWRAGSRVKIDVVGRRSGLVGQAQRGRRRRGRAGADLGLLPAPAAVRPVSATACGRAARQASSQQTRTALVASVPGASGVD